MGASVYEIVARVGKARGLEGKVTAELAGDLPFCLYKGLRVHVVPPALRGPRQLVLSSAECNGGTYCVLTFQGLASIEDVEALEGKFLLADVDDLDLDERDVPDLWIGRHVIDETCGELGVITEILENPVHDVWVIAGAAGEVLLPVVDEFVLDVGSAYEDSIVVRVPEGLM